MAKVTSKLQITLPKRLADEHGIVPGDELSFESVAGAIRMVPAGDPPQSLSVEERLRLFDAASRRVRARQLTEPEGTPESQGRGWAREDLYVRGSTD